MKNATVDRVTLEREAIWLLHLALLRLKLNQESLVHALAGRGDGHGWFHQLISASGRRRTPENRLHLAVHLQSMYGGYLSLTVEVGSGDYPASLLAELATSADLQLVTPTGLHDAAFARNGVATMLDLEPEDFTELTKLHLGHASLQG